MNVKSTILLSLGLSAVIAQAQVPGFINYQGRVTDSAGVGIGNGSPVNRKMIFRVFDAGNAGNRLWSEQQTVTLLNGEFSVLLGQGSAAIYNAVSETPRPPLTDVFASGGVGDRYVEVVVDGGDGTLDNTDTPISPRQRITSTAYAYRAAVADSVAFGSSLNLRDVNHGVGWYGSGRPFNGINVDGPVLYGFGGGALGTNQNGVQSTALQWNAAGNVGIGTGPSASARIGVNGVLGVFDGGTRSLNGGIVSELNGALLNIGVNDSSANRFGGSYTQGSQGGFLRVSAWPNDHLFNFYGRPANSTAAVTSLLSINSAGEIAHGKVTINEPVGTFRSASSGSITLTHANQNSASSIVFKSANNVGSDYGFIQYQDSNAGAENGILSIGTENDADDVLALVPSGNVGVGTYAPAAKLDVVGSLKVSGTSQFSETMVFNSTQFAPPEVGVTGSVGMRLALWPGTTIDTPYGFGIEGSTLFSVVPPSSVFKWYSGTTERMKLDNGGNLTVNSKPVTVAEEQLRFLRGNVVHNPTVTQNGTGWSAFSLGFGKRSITFSTAFSAVPTVTVSSNHGENNFLYLNVYEITNTGCKVELRNSGGAQVDFPFCFIVAGPR